MILFVLAALLVLAVPCSGTTEVFPTFTAINWSSVSFSDIAAAEEALTAPIGCSCVSYR